MLKPVHVQPDTSRHNSANSGVFLSCSHLVLVLSHQFQGNCSQKTKGLNKCRRHSSRVDKYHSSVGWGLAAGFPVSIGNYHRTVPVATERVMSMGAWGHVIGVTVEAGKYPIWHRCHTSVLALCTYVGQQTKTYRWRDRKTHTRIWRRAMPITTSAALT